MEREPCTCSAQYDICPSCKKYEASQRRNRDGAFVSVYKKERWSIYTLDQILTAQSMHKDGCAHDDISACTGIPRGSVRYVLTMKILQESIPN